MNTTLDITEQVTIEVSIEYNSFMLLPVYILVQEIKRLSELAKLWYIP